MAAPTIPPIRLGLIGAGLAVGMLHWPVLRRPAEQDRQFAVHAVSIPREDRHTGTQCRGGVPLAARTRLFCGEIGNHTASNPEIPVAPEPDDTTHNKSRVSSAASFAARTTCSAALASLSRRLQRRPVGTRPLGRTREEWSWKRKRTGRGVRSSG